MRHDKIHIFELRKLGKSYREISKLTGVSRGTLCEWFKDEKWSNHIKNNNNDQHLVRSVEHMKKLNEGRRIILENKYRETEKEAKEEFEMYKKEPLFVAGLMLYAGEGDKRTKHHIRIANTDFFVHKVFLKFIERYTYIRKFKIKCSLLLYPDLNVQECKNKWSEELEISLNNFHKPQVIKGRCKIRRLHFGVGSLIISDSFLKAKIMRWIELAKHNLSN